MAQLTCQNLCVGYDGQSVLQDLSFELLAGDYLCIVGENGSGKSTLMKTILGLQPPISGRILTGDGLRKKRDWLSAAADRCTKGLPGIRERSFSPGARDAAAAALLQQRRKNSLHLMQWTKCKSHSLQGAVIGNYPADSSRGFCLPVRFVLPEKCCSWTSLFPGLTPR